MDVIDGNEIRKTIRGRLYFGWSNDRMVIVEGGLEELDAAAIGHYVAFSAMPIATRTDVFAAVRNAGAAAMTIIV